MLLDLFDRILWKSFAILKSIQQCDAVFINLLIVFSKPWQVDSGIYMEIQKVKARKNWCFWTVVLEKTLESPLDCKETKPVKLEGNQFWIFIGRTGAEAEAPILWPPDSKNWLTGKDPDAGKGWRQKEKGMIEDEMVGWHHWLNGHEFEQAPGVGEGQGSLACCSLWGCKKSDSWVTEQQQYITKWAAQ